VALPFDSTLDLHVTDADRVEVAQALLEAGAAVGAQTALCETPLLIAACFGHQPLIEVLLSHGAVPTLPDKRGWTPLYTACWHNQPGVVSRLLQLVEVQQQLEAATSDGWTALVAASWHGHDRVVPLLLAAGADVQSLSPRGLRPLHAAGTRNHLSVLSMLLAAGADPCAVDGKHQSMLHLAAAWGQQDVLEVLLAALAAGKGSSSSSSSMEAMVHGRTALHWAVEKKQTSCVEMLLAAGANPDVLYGEGGRDRDGSIAGLSTLFAAVRVGHAAAIQLLATPHLLRQTWQGQTPLHRALYEGKADIAQLLIAAGSPAGVPDAAGATAMSLASASIDPALRRLLPAMMRGECELQLQVLQKQQQQHKVGEGGRAAVPAALVDMLYGLVETAWLVTNHWQAVCCIDMVLEVLGPPAATRMLRQVLQRCTRFSSQADARNSAMELLRLTHTGWLQTMEPLLRQRQTVTNRLQYLVTQPLQQQRRRRRRAAAAGALQQARLCEQLQSDVLAACDAGQWGLLVQRMEQLAGLQLCQYKQYFERAVAAHVRKKHAANRRAVMGLCEVLLESWAAAQRELAAGRELVDAVVCAVQAREAQHVMVGSSSWLSRMLPQKCGAGAWRTAASSVLAWCSSLPSSLWFPCWRR
jgi:ankyrin repeat protein